jgi:putative zinc finger/helix-turn-helix YgiT family protein
MRIAEMNEMKEQTKREKTLTRRCYEAGCGKVMTGKRENYQYQEAGLKSVTLLNIVVYHCECGAIVPEIPYAGVLHHCIAMSILQKNALLSGEEIRFVRKLAGFSATDLARVMGMDKVSVSRWENERKKIGKESDRLIRAVCFARMVERLAAIDTDARGDSYVLQLARMARMIQKTDLTSHLGAIEDKSEGSIPVRINPEYLSAMDNGSSLIASPSGIQ